MASAAGSSSSSSSGTTVTLFVTHSNLSMTSETKFNTGTTIGAIKDKLYMKMGTEPQHQVLQLKHADGALAADKLDDSTTLGSYSPDDGMFLHVIDTNEASISAGGALDDVSKVEKFKIDDAKYEASGGSDFRKFRSGKRKTEPVGDDFQQEEADKLSVGDRCKMKKSGALGTIQFVGKMPELKPGFFVGVVLDEAVGRNNGTIKGTKYFEAEEKHGVVVRPKMVEVVAGGGAGGAGGAGGGEDDEL